MPVTPMCKECGARHFNFEDCPTMFGTASGPTPPGLHLVTPHKSNVSILPVPPGYRVYGEDPPPKQAA